MLPKGLLKEYSRVLSLLIFLMDMAFVFVAGCLAYYVKFDAWILSSEYILALSAGVILTPLTLSFFNIYSSVRGKGLISHFFTLFQALAAMSLVLAGLAFLSKTGEMYSRAWFGIWIANAFVLLIAYRLMILMALRFMRTRGLNERVVVIFGAGQLGAKFANSVQQALWTGFNIEAFIDDNAQGKPRVFAGVPVIQTPASLGDYLSANKVDEIWLALPLGAAARVKEILHELRHHTITTRFVLDIFSLDLFSHSITDIAGMPVLNIRSTPMVGFSRLLKAVEDRLIAALILMLISPLFLLIALLIKLSSKGPVFFKQHRHGWDGKIIKVYKFRTMFMHEEQNGQVTQATANDSRVTPLGRFLRKTSLDELPQFINVLQGRMSIVGPRPHALAHNEKYKDSIHTYMQRHRVKPGITGWAQINGWRGETDTLNKMEKRIEYDIFYINNWSLWFDLKIILLTILRGFVSRNAY